MKLLSTLLFSLLVLVVPLLGQDATAPSSPSAGGDTVSELAHQPSLLNMVTNAGWVMVPLAVVSVLTFTIVLFCLFTLRSSSITSAALLQGMEPYLAKGDLKGLAGYVDRRPQASARVVAHVLRFLERHPDADAPSVNSIAEAEAAQVAASLNQRVTYVMDLGVLAPLLGLFGTVIGILNSFGHIAQEQNAQRTLLLAGGVSQALIATASGLLIGITAMGFYAYLRGVLSTLISLLEGEATLLTQEIIFVVRRRAVVTNSIVTNKS